MLKPVAIVLVVVLVGLARSQVSDSDITTILNLHNQARAAKCVGPLTWDSGIASKAQAWANNCDYEHNVNSQGEQVYGYGENLAASYTSEAGVLETATDAVDGWINEINNWDCTTNTCASGEECGHYTQVTDERSTSVGCGVQYCSAATSPFGTNYQWTLWVCDYDPPGNYNGDPPYPPSQCNGCPSGQTVPPATTTNSPSTTAAPTTTTKPNTTTTLPPKSSSTSSDLPNLFLILLLFFLLEVLAHFN